MTRYPRRNDQGETVWACCESSIGPTCQHKRPPGDDERRRDDWLPCATCDGSGVVYVAGPDYFGNYDSGDCPTCSGYGAVAPACRDCGQPLIGYGVRGICARWHVAPSR